MTKRKLNEEEYTNWLNAEVAGSKATLEQKLGIRVNCFAVPFGYYNDRVKKATEDARFEAVFTVYGQKITYGSPNDSLGRYMIEGNKPKVFEDAINFGGSSSGGSAQVTEIPLDSINPAAGRRCDRELEAADQSKPWRGRRNRTGLGPNAGQRTGPRPGQV